MASEIQNLLLRTVGCEEVSRTVSVLIQYTGFQLKPRGRDYSVPGRGHEIRGPGVYADHFESRL